MVVHDHPGPRATSCRAGRRSEFPRPADGRGRPGRPGDVGRFPPGRARDRPAGEGWEGPLAQPAVAPANRVRAAPRLCRGSQGAAGDTRCPALHHRAPRHHHDAAGPGACRAAAVGGGAAPVQPAAPGVHPALRTADPGRPPAAVLDPPQHSRPRLVPCSEACPERPAVDCQAGQHQPARQHRSAGPAALDRPRTVVAPGNRHPVAGQRPGVLPAAVQHRPVAPGRPDQLGGLPERRLGAAAVRLARLAGRERLRGLQQPAAAGLLRHGLRRRAACPADRPGDVTRAVDALPAYLEGPEHPDGPVAALPGAGVVRAVHRPACDLRGHDRTAAQPQSHLHRHRQPELARVRAVRPVDGGSGCRVGCCDAAHAAVPEDGPADRCGAHRSRGAVVRAPRR